LVSVSRLRLISPPPLPIWCTIPPTPHSHLLRPTAHACTPTHTQHTQHGQRSQRGQPRYCFPGSLPPAFVSLPSLLPAAPRYCSPSACLLPSVSSPARGPLPSVVCDIPRPPPAPLSCALCCIPLHRMHALRIGPARRPLCALPCMLASGVSPAAVLLMWRGAELGARSLFRFQSFFRPPVRLDSRPVCILQLTNKHGSALC